MQSNITRLRRADGTFPPLSGADDGPNLKDKLRRVEADIAAARDERKELQATVDKARDEFASADGYDVNSEEFKAAEQSVRDLGACDDRIAELQSAQVGILRMLGKSAPPPAGDAQKASQGGGWSSVQQLMEEPEVAQLFQDYAFASTPIGRREIGAVASRDAFVADITGTTNMRRGDFYGIVPQLTRPLSILDLIPVGAMDQNTVPYVVESGALTGAAPQVEGQAKAEAARTFTDAEATARTIAAYQKLQKQSLADTPSLRSIIEQRLRYMVEYELEEQILSGDGTAPNLRGILNTSGIGSVAYSASELTSDQVLRGITTVLLANAMATGIVMNPTDWQDALIAKASGDGHYYSGGPFSVTPQQMWGVPVVPTAGIPQGTVLVGAWNIGAMLFIREGLRVLLSDSDQNDFTTNRVTLLAELRAALAVFRPAAFCAVDLAA